MTKDEQYQEQLHYIRSIKDEMFRFLQGAKIGFDLNMPIYFADLTIFELRKKYTKVAKEFSTERFITEEYKDVLDAVWVNPNEDTTFSIKDSLKAEARFSVISNFMREVNKSNKKLYPSEYRRKEATLNNAVKRAHKLIDAYFEKRDVFFHEISEVMDIYEIIIRDNGRLVDFHYGRRGMSLSKDHSSEEMLAQVVQDKAEFKKKKELVGVRLEAIEQLMKQAMEQGFSEGRETELSALSRDLPFSDFALRDKSLKQLESELANKEENIKKLILFYQELKTQNVKLPKEAKFHVDQGKVSIGYFNYSYGQNGAHAFSNLYSQYQKVADFIDVVVKELKRIEASTKAHFDGYSLKFVTNIKEKAIEAVRNRIYSGRHRQSRVSISLTCSEDKLYRVTGEEVLTPEVVVFEMKEKIRTIDEIYLESVEKARDMFMATLSDKEEKLMKEKDITILEGAENYYALLNSQTYNNVVRIPKKLRSLDEIKALCIHPEDTSVPMYDGFAAISFAIKAGDEEYVLENSNEFNLSKSIKNQVVEVFKSFLPHHQLKLA